MKARSTLRKEQHEVYELWKEARVGSARGWFLLGALWALTWARGKSSRPARFASNGWECDDPRKHVHGGRS